MESDRDLVAVENAKPEPLNVSVRHSLPPSRKLPMDPMIAALLRAEAYSHPVETIQLLQTHLSWVLLTGRYAYKLKKPVNLGFVDFSSQTLRRWFCQEELRLNRRLAPDLYLDLVTIHGPPEQASFHGTGPPIEVAVRMRQFPQQALISELLKAGDGDLVPAHFDRLADDLAAFHASAATATAAVPFGDPDMVLLPAQANLDVLEAQGAESQGVDPNALLKLRLWTESEHSRLRNIYIQRKRDGRIRECHGDLHLGNMALRLDRIEVFDCLEFNPSLRWIDVISDMAFLAMDLQCRGRPDLATRVLNRWLERSGDGAGLHTWRWYLVYRALVRAKVAVLSRADPDLPIHHRQHLEKLIASYITVAQEATKTSRPTLLITHGVSGSGKTHQARKARGEGWMDSPPFRRGTDAPVRTLAGRPSKPTPGKSL